MVKSTQGQAREIIGLEEYNTYRAKGTVITDDRRRRPLWFDGRFLDAAALNSEQNYFLGRQADIARVAGVGVVQGLNVSRVESKSRTLSISAGHGITPAGELVIIPENLTVDLADVPEIQKLDASFGIAEIPKQTSRNRSGLYILALRPVEFSADPIASYPTAINAARSVEDGNIVEATSITLIPYQDQGARLELNQRRQHVAREIFLQDNKKGQPTGVLPLAMLALNLGVIQWLDMFMVRREVGARDHDVFGLGLSPRALREAYLRHYHNQLTEILTEAGNGNTHFIASEHFAALPAAGPMPAASIDVEDFTQAFFPSEMNVDLSIIPDDELPALIEDSYSLPPIDLTLSGDEFESTSVLILIPVPRAQLRQLSLSLKTLLRPLLSAAPGLVSKRKPITALSSLGSIRLTRVTPTVINADENLWRQTLQAFETLWYIRRRNVSFKDEIVAEPVLLSRDEVVIEGNVNNLFKQLDLSSSVTSIKRRATIAAEAEVMQMFSSPVMQGGSATVIKAAMQEINKLESIDRSSVMTVVERYTQPAFGEGLARLEKAQPSIAADTKINEGLVGSGKLPELDQLSRAMAPAEFDNFAKKLTETASSGGRAQAKKVAGLIDETLSQLDKTSLTTSSDKQAAATHSIRGIRAT